MMGRSHVLIGLAGVSMAVAAGIAPLSSASIIAAVVGSLAPDVDTPYSVLGRLLPFVSHPLYRTVGHRTLTHSVFGLGFWIVIAILLEPNTPPFTGLAFLFGYFLHIVADLLTAEGVVLLYPVARRRYRYWPAVKTGGAGESVALAFILLATAAGIYSLHPWLLEQPYRFIARSLGG